MNNTFTNKWEEKQLAKVKKFLAEYKVLCEKYQLCINSCECCSSPWVDSFEDDMWYPTTVNRHIEHLETMAGINDKHIDL